MCYKNKEVSTKCATRTRQSQNTKAYKISTKQIDKHTIMATEQANITEAIVQIVAEAARAAVLACGTQTRHTHH